MRTLAITIFTFNVTFGAAWSVLVLYARERLGLGALGFGLITTAIAAGGLLGNDVVERPQRAVPAEFQGRVGSVYLMGMIGGIVIGSALGGLAASAWGITAPFWLAFAGSALILVVIWRPLLHIAHDDDSIQTTV